MSNKAQDWAWSQNLPPKVKCVLVALCDQADDLGFVRYRDTTTQFFMQKCNIPERSFYRIMAALIRQSYVKRETHRGRGQVSDIWVSLDRLPTPIEAWRWGAPDPQDVEVDLPMVADQNSELICHGEHIDLPSVAEQDSLEKNQRDQRARAEKPVGGFSRDAQDVERHRLAEIAAKPAMPPGRVFVQRGTRAWEAWIAYRRRMGMVPSMPVRDGHGEHAGKTGWYLPSLFPPSTGPPTSGIDEAAAKEFAKYG